MKLFILMSCLALAIARPEAGYLYNNPSGGQVGGGFGAGVSFDTGFSNGGGFDANGGSGFGGGDFGGGDFGAGGDGKLKTFKTKLSRIFC
jgi:hypothetical protein